jgi:adenine-specific DNA-methyltransferase
MEIRENALYNSDNIALLKIMVDSGTKVNHLHVDPPYGTGSSDFRYSDNGNFEKWESQMVDTFVLAAQILQDDGVCVVYIDDKNYAYLKVILDRIFGRANYIGTFIWKKSHTVKNDSKTISVQHEHILFYAKDIKKVVLNRADVSAEYIKSAYRHKDENGLYRTVPLHKKKNEKKFKVTSPFGVEWELGWNYNEEGMVRLEREKMIHWGTKSTAMPSKKVYLKPVMTQTFGTILNPDDVGYTGDGGKDLTKLGFENMAFLYAKPVKLCKFIIGVFIKPGDVVMDFFAGSGTTGHALMELNKEKNLNAKFVLVTNNENGICENVTKPRLQRSIELYNFDESFVFEEI